MVKYKTFVSNPYLSDIVYEITPDGDLKGDNVIVASFTAPCASIQDINDTLLCLLSNGDLYAFNESPRKLFQQNIGEPVIQVCRSYSHIYILTASGNVISLYIPLRGWKGYYRSQLLDINVKDIFVAETDLYLVRNGKTEIRSQIFPEVILPYEIRDVIKSGNDTYQLVGKDCIYRNEDLIVKAEEPILSITLLWTHDVSWITQNLRSFYYNPSTKEIIEYSIQTSPIIEDNGKMVRCLNGELWQ